MLTQDGAGVLLVYGEPNTCDRLVSKKRLDTYSAPTHYNIHSVGRVFPLNDTPVPERSIQFEMCRCIIPTRFVVKSPSTNH